MTSLQDKLVKTFLKLYKKSDPKNEKCAYKVLERLRRSNSEYNIPSIFKKDYNEEYFMGMKYFYKQGAVNKLIIYLHGGSFVFEPLIFHWWFLAKLYKNTKVNLVVPIYLKAPNFTAKQSIDMLYDFYKAVAQNFNGEIIIMGDSAGATLAFGLSMLIRDEYQGANASKIILISPCCDLSFENPAIDSVQKDDFMLCKDVLRVYTREWMANNFNSPYINPILGSFDDLPEVSLFIGTRDILYPDCQKTISLAEKQGVKINNYVYRDLTHCFPLYPTPEARHARNIVYDIINS